MLSRTLLKALAVVLLSAFLSAQGVGGKAGLGGKAGFGGGVSAGGSSPSFVQACQTAVPNTNADRVCTFSVGTTSGNSILVYGNWNYSSLPVLASTNVTGAGGTASVINHYEDPGGTENAMYLVTGVTAGTTTVTLNVVSDTTNMHSVSGSGIIAFEVASTSGVETFNFQPNTTGTAATNGQVCGSMTTAIDHDLIVFGIFDRTDFNITTWSAGTSPFTFTIPTNGLSSFKMMGMEYGTQATHGAIVPTFTADVATDNYEGICVALKP